jgi:hypothetical protein
MELIFILLTCAYTFLTLYVCRFVMMHMQLIQSQNEIRDKCIAIEIENLKSRSLKFSSDQNKQNRTIV